MKMSIDFNSFIVGHQKSSYSDWPTKLPTVLFLPGCDLRCPTCHNKSIAYGSNLKEYISFDTIEVYINKHKQFIDGIVITGGEPLIHENILDFISFIKVLFNLPIKLDTNGMHPNKLEELLKSKLIDLVAMDIKGSFELYPQLTGREDKEYTYFKENITQCIELYTKYDQQVMYRTTLVPLINNKETIATIRSYIPKDAHYRLQTYREPSN